MDKTLQVIATIFAFLVVIFLGNEFYKYRQKSLENFSQRRRYRYS